MDKKYLLTGETKVLQDEQGNYHTYIEVVTESSEFKPVIAKSLKHEGITKLYKLIDWEVREK